MKKNNKGYLRIYIVLSIIWFIYFLKEINFGTCLGSMGLTLDGVKYEKQTSFIGHFMFCNSLKDFISFAPIPLYYVVLPFVAFVFRWINEGFKDK
jgi:hypothetical protein